MVATLRTFCPDIRRPHLFGWELECWDDKKIGRRRSMFTIRSERHHGKTAAATNARRWAAKFDILIVPAKK